MAADTPSPSALHTKYGLSAPVNVRGKATVLGASRAAAPVAAQAAAAMREWFVMDELVALADRTLCAWVGAADSAEGSDAATSLGGCVTHCSASGITLACAACVTLQARRHDVGPTAGAPSKADTYIEALPDTTAFRRRTIVMQAGQDGVNFGAPVTQMVRLCGAEVCIAGSSTGDDGVPRCSADDVDAVLADRDDVAAVLHVESTLSKGTSAALADVVRVAARHGVPVIVDGAAQDLRAREIVASGATLSVFSSQKYLAGPTAGLIVGARDYAAEADAHHRGIGRGMKPSKEGILGVLAALETRSSAAVSSLNSDAARVGAGAGAGAGAGLEDDAARSVRASKEVIAALSTSFAATGVAYRVVEGGDAAGDDARGDDTVIEVMLVPDKYMPAFSRVAVRLPPATDGSVRPEAKRVASDLASLSPPVVVSPHKLGANVCVLEAGDCTEAELSYAVSSLAQAVARVVASNAK